MGDAERPAILEVRELVVRYGSQTAVDGLGFSILRGEIFGLLGPNGAGKTTTLSVIEGLKKPVSGSVSVDGASPIHAPLAVKAKLGVQLQASSFQAELTIEQLARLHAGLYGLDLPRRALRDRLADVGLEQEAAKPFKKLSGGQQQRFSLMVATIHDPPILLLDEPTSGLDPQSRRQLWDRIERSREAGGSVLLTTHSMEEAQAVCDRVAIIDHGRLQALGAPGELVAMHRDDPRVRAVARGDVTLEDVFIGLTGSAIRD
ncbi:ABC transporter ATP-binding protein [Sinomonas sp. ASV322]|uniref:ABC transporter ATP-binding protein n=1 Tax=Sinomonas sp. ASV322 TaxID=3041920 RepID=UPI0027DDD43E|nr:ABC transporter ATP-binding protein [Sinomonas sp. ASV322]MDQ4501604.1 ABC transporter ATP-binding protein [Sinomonas sp. ASV322]